LLWVAVAVEALAALMPLAVVDLVVAAVVVLAGWPLRSGPQMLAPLRPSPLALGAMPAQQEHQLAA
jgi:hypothetical protein